MPPIHTGTPWSRHMSWILRERVRAAGAAGLDVDVLAGVDFQGLLDRAQLAGGLVQTDGRLDLPREFGVVDDVVPLERLFEEGQSKLVDGLEGVEVVQGVAGVAVDVEDGVGEGTAYGAQHLDVPAGAGLELDAGEASVHGALDVGEQVVEGVQYPEVGAGDHVGVGAAQEGGAGEYPCACIRGSTRGLRWRPWRSRCP